MHREIQIKQFPIVTTHWWPKTRNEQFVWENEQYLYRFFTSCTQPCPSDLSAHTHPVCDVCVRALWLTLHSHGASVSTLDGGRVWSVVLTRRHSYNNQSHTSLVLHERDWVFAWGDLIGWRLRWRLKSFQLLPRAAPVKRRDGPSIQFGKAWRHAIQSQREALTPTPRVNGALVCASAGKRRKAPESAGRRRKWSLARIRHSLPERTHTRHTPDACAHSDHLDMVVYKR